MVLPSTQLHLAELKQAFSGNDSVSKLALKDFYFRLNPSLTEQVFRRILYALEKKDVLISIGAGLFAFSKPLANQTIRQKFVPLQSKTQIELDETLRKTYPYLDYLIWETRLFHEWMIHQPGTNQIILETEKDACETIFNHLRQIYPGQVFLEPDRTVMERYVLSLPESILISRLITQAPQKKTRGIVSPRLEKILVDIFADQDRFFIFQGDELVQIFENAFLAHWINARTLFRYAGRRKVEERLKQFIRTQTNIKFNPSEEKNL